MGAIRSIAAAVGIGESAAEKAKKKEKRAAQAAAEVRTKKANAAAAVVTKRKTDAQGSEEGKASAASKLALIATSSQGVLSQASTGRRKLFGN